MKGSNLMSINQMYHSEISKLYYKLGNGTNPDCFRQLFVNQIRAAIEVCYSIRTRSSSNHFQPFGWIRLTQQAFNFQDRNIWNSIHNDEYCAVENALFTKNIKGYVIDNKDFIWGVKRG